jgi:protoporphyrinogen oxidase
MDARMQKQTAIIIGAGPAGLTAAYELLARTDIRPIVIEKSEHMGGICRTVSYKGNRIDMGGHRFFSKSDRVMQWWLDILPLQQTSDRSPAITYHRMTRDVTPYASGPDPTSEDRVMLIRKRKSRIYFLRRLFDYPISLSADTIRKLGLARVLRIGMSYGLRALFPLREERNLEQFLINRFGEELYRTFFKSYTEKVWGVACSEISAEWGRQRTKGLSVWKMVAHFVRKRLRGGGELAREQTETSLIEQFLYPKYGPGQMWEEVARRVKGRGGEILTSFEVGRILTDGGRITAVEATSAVSGERRVFPSEYVFSTMPVQELIRALDARVPEEVAAISEGLVYRDFVTVGLLLKDLKLKDVHGGVIEDNWIYIQEPDVLVGRVQIFNNWSPYMVADPDTVWIGLEYFCYETDPLWRMPDAQLMELGIRELESIGIIERDQVLDATVLRMPKAYPAYFGSYHRFETLRAYLDRFANLFLLGRNGMHKYNNQDHSMLSAMTAVDNILHGITTKDNIWAVNTEQEYHEEDTRN